MSPRRGDYTPLREASDDSRAVCQDILHIWARVLVTRACHTGLAYFMLQILPCWEDNDSRRAEHCLEWTTQSGSRYGFDYGFGSGLLLLHASKRNEMRLFVKTPESH